MKILGVLYRNMTPTMNTLTQKQKEEFITNNITNMPVTEICKHLEIPFQTVYKYIERLGLKKRGAKYDRKVDVSVFAENISKESAYILGLLWTDGHIVKDNSTIQIEALKTDLDTVQNVFLKTGEWSISERTRKNRTKVIKCFRACNKELNAFFTNYDYREKSTKSPCKILKHIPENLHKWFWRGFLDGDGCIYINKVCQQISFAGSFNQDWTALENLLAVMKIPYRVSRRQSDKGDSSVVKVMQRDAAQRLLSYIYNEYEIDKIGFPRKYEKAKLVIARERGRYAMPKTQEETEKSIKFLSKNWCHNYSVAGLE